MRYERVYARRQRAVTFAGSTRTITIPLETADFERLERLAIKRNLGNATLGREIIREYLKRQADQRPRLPQSAQAGSAQQESAEERQRQAERRKSDGIQTPLQTSARRTSAGAAPTCASPS
jgi:hypothetical protein